ncbi:FAD/NAD(P)-binding domain-containing protein [Lentinula aciculospora]|uniref:FAD/NAD(P)-binding domain-containing protein n=1 Tax=Lentinula aciculospora TaxID=153920 RepID=A0A9W9AHX4_9AGAR|nr:FAD/NAD(P)-binding domain-containing protein [Lentinula aciculospora]
MKVAVVGSGVSGLAATWLLNEHSDHEVHLYEADNRPGGHANTVRFPSKEGIDVDCGFIVFNPCTYPNFLRFLKRHPKIPIAPTEMTFSVSRDHGKFEWAGDTIFTVFCQLRRLIDPNMWRMLYDVLRFNASAQRLVVQWNRGAVDKMEMSVGEYLDKEGYSESFKDNYLIASNHPMTAAIWSTPPDKCALDFPARTLIQFMHNHHLLQITGKPSWLTIPGGSHQYVKTILSSLPASQLHLSTPVTAIYSNGSSIELTTAFGQSSTYDHVILACHSNTALSILRTGGDVTKDEEKILGMFEWNQNVVIVHNDIQLMPKARSAWSCWNYLTYSEVDEKGNRKANREKVSLTYGMNDLQHISEKEHGPVLVTLNPPFEPVTNFGRHSYEHPVLDGKAVQAQGLMLQIQGKRNISYAGAYLKYGFHEDGFTSGLLAASAYAPALKSNVRLPFEIEYAEGHGSNEGKAVCGTYHSTSNRGAGIVEWLAFFFDVFEYTGLRAVVGLMFGTGLTCIICILSICGFNVEL